MSGNIFLYLRRETSHHERGNASVPSFAFYSRVKPTKFRLIDRANGNFSMVETHITNLLETLFQEEEFEDCYLIDINHSSNRLQVFIDADDGVTFQQCQRISRYLEGYLDEEGWLGEKYILEVSSPGISRPLKLPRQYPKNIGRKMEVKTKAGETFEGTLTEVQENRIVLEEKKRVKEGKKKVNKEFRYEIPFTDVRRAKVKVSFNK